MGRNKGQNGKTRSFYINKEILDMAEVKYGNRQLNKIVDNFIKMIVLDESPEIGLLREKREEQNLKLKLIDQQIETMEKELQRRHISKAETLLQAIQNAEAIKEKNDNPKVKIYVKRTKQ